MVQVPSVIHIKPLLLFAAVGTLVLVMYSFSGLDLGVVKWKALEQQPVTA
jgi:hypothetical protein